MSKSRKKVCGGTICCCKSQKRGKQLASRRFRRIERHLMTNKMYNLLPLRSSELTNEWLLGGDGKMVYSWNIDDDIYRKYIRK